MSNSAVVPPLPPSPLPLWRSPTAIIIVGCLIALVSFGVRSSFGLFLDPMTLARGWDRQTYSLAMAIQNLLWGIGVPIAGMLADRFGPSRVLALGAVLYAAGFFGMAYADSALLLNLTGGVLTGLGIAFTGFAIALAAIAKVVGPDRRSFALGLGTAAGSAGQVLFSPLSQALISQPGIDWFGTLLILGSLSLVVIPLAYLLPNDPGGAGRKVLEQTMGAALKEAMGNRGFLLLTTGFFVCGFQVAFLTIHFPTYVKDVGLPAYIGATAIALVGLFNIAGSLMAGAFGQRYSKKWGLSFIYAARSVVTIGLLLAPKTEWTILLYAAVMGLLWLSTVPLTSGLVAQIFGVRYMATLFGIVFFSHQVGSFLGVWLGGYVYDHYHSYDLVWLMNIALGFVAALVHMPINETPMARLQARAAG